MRCRAPCMPTAPAPAADAIATDTRRKEHDGAKSKAGAQPNRAQKLKRNPLEWRARLLLGRGGSWRPTNEPLLRLNGAEARSNFP